MGTCWGTGVTVLLLSSMAASRSNMRTNVCKWCDNSHPVCDGGVCLTNCSLSSYCENPEEICVTIWKEDNESLQLSTRCHHPLLLLENFLVPNYNTSLCVMSAMPSVSGRLYTCACKEEQECNDKLIFYNHSNGFSMLHSREVVPVAVISLLPPFLCTVMVTVLFYLYRTQRLSKISHSWSYKGRYCLEEQIKAGGTEEYNCRLSPDLISNSHSDMRSLCANSINHNTERLPIELDQRVGKGRFAEVWRAKLRHSAPSHYEMVAVKIFPCQEFSSWKNESWIFADASLKHENVLQFITTEIRGTSLQKEYWIITTYHAKGNLKDYLASHVLNWTTFLKMAGSIVNGVAHLHNDCTPCGAIKIPIAHRDIKSTNILVKNNCECVVCDFGIAVRLDPSLTTEDFANSGQVGTARYMAPEVLESRVNLEDLESFKQMDVYSLSLVLWELGTRCDAVGEVKSYELPFGSKVREQPCVEIMRDLVLHGRVRPEIPDTWRRHPGLDILCDTITECWDHDPEARLTAHCVAERFILITQMDCDTTNYNSAD
ncbi:TGF-beta receptor type-2 [Xenopus laevis]|uniref:Serine/threonine-protein kinase receptor n=2 Tax=Xenopus laevis TaxID=8355 RepID=A0A1L8ENK0_XENLA|nr:TGF-beta receptor type-2 [Xenopus laevis]OCT60890.1 hypothetical protein XELAEV_18046915mg [Xenopus laevis]